VVRRLRPGPAWFLMLGSSCWFLIMPPAASLLPAPLASGARELDGGRGIPAKPFYTLPTKLGEDTTGFNEPETKRAPSQGRPPLCVQLAGLGSKYRLNPDERRFVGPDRDILLDFLQRLLTAQRPGQRHGQPVVAGPDAPEEIQAMVLNRRVAE